jgi:hypothetical protein
VIPADQHIWRLSKCGDQNLALACTEDGLFLGRTPLLERHGGGLLRPRDDIERLLSHAYGPAIGVERLLGSPQPHPLSPKRTFASLRSPRCSYGCLIFRTGSLETVWRPRTG